MSARSRLLFVIAVLATVVALRYAYNSSAITGAIFGVLNLAFVAFVVLLGFASFWPIPAICYGERRFWGWRDSRLVSGWTFWIPEKLGGRIATLSTTPQEATGSVAFTTNDTIFESSRAKPQVICDYYLKYKADPNVRDSAKRNAFLGTTPAAIEREINATLKGKLGNLGGVIGSNDFLVNRSAIEDFIRCTLQMEVPPHKRHNGCRVPGCNYVGTREIPSGKILDFYNTHREAIGEEIRTEKSRATDMSGIERSNGIDVELFKLEKVDFSEETKKALNEEEVQRARARGLEIQRLEAKKLMDTLVGLSPEEALTGTQAALLGTPLKDIRVRGGGQAVIIEGGIPGLGGASGKADKGGSGGGGRGGRR
ncbi:MAG: hypothetical protein HY434_02625 [Candidatus Liptonbacteria bacterium]|nr:hypothetical protein [Candidatus Liptonbacteria bacterium]